MRIARTTTDDEEPINLMPLIDMVFLLLIFFLVATTIASEERELNMQLPTTAAAQPLNAPPPQLIINILEDGTMKVAGDAYDRDQLAGVLVNVATNEPDRKILIRADLNSIHMHLAAVLTLCVESGIDESNIGYLFQQPGNQ